MSKRDFYDILGAQKSASADELKSAYRRKAKELHPDRNADDPNAEAKFKELNEAYDALKDPQKRAAYDQYGHAAFEGGFGAGAGARGGDFSSAFADVFDDLFNDFMGGGGRRGQSRSSRGADLRYNLDISLEDAFKGKQASIKVPSAVSCESCSGSGAKAGSKPDTCSTCGGAGKVRQQQAFFVVERTCPACSGRGQVISDPCTNCKGRGRVQRERSLNVQIPAGVEDGTRIRLAGEGESGTQGGSSGDLYIFLQIKEHEIFRREGPDLFCTIPLPMTTATLGGHIEAPTIDGGRAKLTIPPGTQNGKRFRLRSKGMPTLRSNRTGDLYVEVQVETPVNLTRKQQELLEEFKKIAPNGENSPQSSGFFQRVKELWGSH